MAEAFICDFVRTPTGRMVALQLSLTGKQRALVTMCIGVGQGVAVALEAAN